MGLILIYFLLHIPKDVQSTEFKSLSLSRRILKLDPVGAVLIIGAVVSILLALQWGGQSLPFNSSTVIGLLVGFGVLLITFFVIQYFRGDDATLPLRLLRQRSILSGAVFSLFFSMPSYVVSLADTGLCITWHCVSLTTRRSMVITYQSTFKLSKKPLLQLVVHGIWRLYCLNSLAWYSLARLLPCLEYMYGYFHQSASYQQELTPLHRPHT